MKIVHAYPPNIAAIDAAFRVRGKRGIVFAYGDTIYAPDTPTLHPSLIAHERVHCERQLASHPKLWWDSYIADRLFRLNEELLAHRAELQTRLDENPGRNERRKWLSIIAHKLADPLYGNLISVARAKKELLDGRA